MNQIKKIKDRRELKRLLKDFMKSQGLSGYQIYDIEKKPEFTDLFRFKKDKYDQSMLVYNELKIPSVIIRSYSPESLKSYLEKLSRMMNNSFLLFIEGHNDPKLIKKIVESKFSYNFFSEEEILGFNKNLNLLDKNDSHKNLKWIVDKATEKDLENILSIYDEFNRRAYNERQYLDQIRKGFSYILKEKDKIAGVITLHTSHKNTSILGGFRISEDYQNKGLGKLFLSKFSRNILKNSDQIVTYAPSSNKKVCSLIRSIGYSKLGKRFAFAIDNNLKPFF